MAKITTHVLDTASGRPAAGLSLELWRITASGRQRLLSTITNSDGRTDQPLLSPEQFVPGTYEIIFQVADYFQKIGAIQNPHPFLTAIPVRFYADPATGNYHVPLLCSPWSYTTYRGS